MDISKSRKDFSPGVDYSIYYRLWHNESDDHAALQIDHLRRVLCPHLLPPSPEPVLDIGCGMGFAILMLHELGYQDVRGIEIERSQFEACRRRCLNVELVDDPLEYLAHSQELFSMVFLLDVLEHVSVAQQIPLMQAVYRRLKPGGRVILRVPNANAMFATRWQYQDFTHHCSFTEISIRFVLLNASFDHVDVPPDNWLPPRPRLRQLLRLYRRDVRRQFRLWLVRSFWHHAFSAEFEGRVNVADIPMDLNLLAIGHKTL